MGATDILLIDNCVVLLDFIPVAPTVPYCRRGGFFNLTT
uniref:Uncharacterized protein n=1 Tax=Siphoviridae sp. ctub511 TaxID=2825714 RepID=A0A8S5U0X5_9CAUD|nr:MAG TPA: hypothetical protein [Siphoviridae sp. ctub511]